MAFLLGLDPILGNKVSKFFTQVADADEDIIRYRQLFDRDECKTERNVEIIFKTLCECYQEMTFSQLQALPKTTNTEFNVSDMYLGNLTDESTFAFATDVLSHCKCSIIS